jgi:hypothetical protein
LRVPKPLKIFLPMACALELKLSGGGSGGGGGGGRSGW